MKRIVICGWIFICVIGLMLASCNGQKRGAEEILRELCAVGAELPEGEIYRSGAEEGSDGYLSPSLARSLYGDGAEEIFGMIEEYAIYLSSFAAPYEIAVFRCYSASDAHEVAAMCLNRSDELRVGLRRTEFERLGESIRIVIRGRFVIMTMTEEPDAIEREALRLVR